MSIRTFMQLVDIKTKFASLFPFLIGSLFTMYYFDTFNLVNTVIFFSSMLIFDLTTTAINNYMDYKKATTDEYRQKQNVIGQQNISERLVKIIILLLLSIAIGLGIWLVFLTDLFVLIIGLGCFAVGVFYTFGPIPLSRMPVGEIFSGLTMGFGIIFLIVYVNIFDQGMIEWVVQGHHVFIQANFVTLAKIVLVSLPCVLTIAAVMLANNICDLEEDIQNDRYTLPYFLGVRRSIVLFNLMYISTFIAILVAVFLKLMPSITLLSFIVIYPVYANVRRFNRVQLKSKTFPFAVQNLVFVNGALVLLLGISIL